jgi:23S rRNA (uracil1939-C5)-methyltransferase
LQEDPSNAIRNEVRDFANANGLFLTQENTGFIENLNCVLLTGEIMVLIQFFENDKE